MKYADVCESAAVVFFCAADEAALCCACDQKCDMIVHVGGKRVHGRYLMLRQKVEFPGDTSGLTKDSENKREYTETRNQMVEDEQSNHIVAPTAESDANADRPSTRLIDLNIKPHRLHGQASNDPPG